MKKYVLCSGEVKSRDGDKHWITARMLLGLYQLNQSECILFEKNDYEKNKKLPEGVFCILRPRPDGDYQEHLKTLGVK